MHPGRADACARADARSRNDRTRTDGRFQLMRWRWTSPCRRENGGAAVRMGPSAKERFTWTAGCRVRNHTAAGTTDGGRARLNASTHVVLAGDHVATSMPHRDERMSGATSAFRARNTAIASHPSRMEVIVSVECNATIQKRCIESMRRQHETRVRESALIRNVKRRERLENKLQARRYRAAVIAWRTTMCARNDGTNEAGRVTRPGRAERRCDGSAGQDVLEERGVLSKNALEARA